MSDLKNHSRYSRMRNYMSSARSASFVGLLALAMTAAPAVAGLLHGSVLVSDGADTKTLGPSNGSRSVAAGPDGTIHVAYQANLNAEVRVASSSDRGMSFLPSVLAFSQPGASVSASEIAVSSLGNIYVASVLTTGELELSRSMDGGLTFSAQQVGTSTSPGIGVHVATEGHRVYLGVATTGGVRVSASDDDGATFTSVDVTMSIAYFNMLVDPITGDLVLAADTPEFHIRVSSDHGATFAAEQNPAGTDYYSAWTISSGPAGRFLLVAGSDLGGSLSTAARIDLANFSAQNLPAFGSTGTAQSRSLFADSCGNVIDSYNNDGLGTRAFHVSTDLGSTFGAEYAVSASTSQSVVISPAQGDVLFSYVSGNQIYLNTYSDELPVSCYQPEISATDLDFGSVLLGASSSPQNVTLTNNGSATVTINAIDTTGEFAHNGGACVGPLLVGTTCSIPITFSPTTLGIRLGQLQVQTSTTTRTVALRGVGIDFSLDVSVAGEGSVSAAATPIPNSGAITDCSSTGGSCSARYSPGASVELATTPLSGWRFAGWSGDSACSSGTVAMNADHACNATFLQNTISGGAGGLNGSGLTLHLDYGSGSEDLVVGGGSTSFAFTAAVPTGASYSVTISTQPTNPNQTCNVANSSGTMPSGSVTNVIVFCGSNSYSVGGTISGLTASGLILRLNGGNDLVIAGGDSAFTFTSYLASGSSYSVAVAQQPSGEFCIIGSANGTVSNANITDVAVTCASEQAQLSLSVSDGAEYARYGQISDYLVTLSNTGNATATGVSIASIYSAALDVQNSTWICIPNSPTVQCTMNGAGALVDTVVIPANQSVSWLVSVPVFPDSNESTAELAISANGASFVDDIDTLVILRTGFDQTYGNGAIAPVTPIEAAGILDGTAMKSFMVPPATGAFVDDALVFEARGNEVRVQHIALSSGSFVRLLIRSTDGREQGTIWTRVDPSAILTIASVAGPDEQRIMLLQGAALELSIRLPD